MTTTTAAMYLRISSDQNGDRLGVTCQPDDCLKLCSEKAWDQVEYVDNDISAFSGKRRPAYERMLNDIRDGKINAVVAWDLDRLHRRPVELEYFMTLADEKQLALATVSGDVDLSTAQGRLVARLKGSVASHEVEQLKARIRRAARQKAENGIPQWRQAFGDTGDGTRQPDPKTAPLVRQAYASIRAGASLGDICRLFNGAGAHGLNGKPWTESTVSLSLRAARNAGLRSHNDQLVTDAAGQAVKGTWPALVDENTWRAVQHILSAPERKPGRKSVRRHLLTGLLTCGRCGHHLGGQVNSDKTVSYVCRKCRACSIRAQHIEPLVFQLFSGRLAMPDAVDLLRAEQADEAEAERIRAERNAPDLVHIWGVGVAAAR